MNNMVGLRREVPRTHRITFVLALFAMVIGCKDAAILGEISIADASTADNDNNVPIIRLQPDSTVTGGAATIALNNTSRQTVAVSRIVYSHPEKFSINATEVPGEIAPGDSTLIAILFHPAEGEVPVSSNSYRSSVHIYLEDRNSPIEFIVSVNE